MKEITPIQYAKYYGYHKSYVHRLLLKNEWDKLPDILDVKRYSRFYLLIVSEDVYNKINST